MSAHDPDLMRRIELERSDAKKEALEEVIQTIQNQKAGASYQSAFKRMHRLVTQLKAKQ